MQWEGRSLGFYPREGATALLGAPPHTRPCLWLAHGTRGGDGLQAGTPPHTPSSSTPDATAPSPEPTCVSRAKRSCGRCGAHHTRLADQRKTNSGSSGGSNQPSGSPFLEGPLRAQWTGGLRERGQESVPCLARQSSRAPAGQIASGLLLCKGQVRPSGRPAAPPLHGSALGLCGARRSFPTVPPRPDRRGWGPHAQTADWPHIRDPGLGSSLTGCFPSCVVFFSAPQSLQRRPISLPVPAHPSARAPVRRRRRPHPRGCLNSSRETRPWRTWGPRG